MRVISKYPNVSALLDTGKIGVVFILILLVFPLIIRDSYVLHLVILSLLYAVLSSSWNFICGYTGVFTFGHQGFFGIGAYTSALLAIKMGVSPWIGLLLGGIVASFLSLFIGLPCLRLRSAAYISLTSLGFAEILRLVCMNLVGLTRGELGLWGIPGLTDLHIGSWTVSFSGADRTPNYYVMIAIFTITTTLLYRQIRSPKGLALKAIRESQEAAESLGVPITAHKIYAFLLSSFFAGVVGAFYAHYIGILTPTSIFNVGVMVEIVAMTLLGGLGTFAGPIVGAFFLTIGLEYLRSFGEYRFMIYGALLVIIILFMPAGLVNKIAPSGEKA